MSLLLSYNRSQLFLVKSVITRERSLTIRRGVNWQKSIKSKPRYKFKQEEKEYGSQGKIGLAGYSLLAVPIATFFLGVWQVNRRRWKLDLMQHLKEKLEKPPMSLPDRSHPDYEYERVLVKGKFDYSEEVLVGPRSKVTKDGSAGGGLVSTGDATGWIIVTPFEVSDSNRRILVNRGWIPKKAIKICNRLPRHSGEVEFTGIIRMTEPRQQCSPQNKVKTNTWHTRDISALAGKLNTEEFYLDADESLTLPGGPVGGQTRMTLRNDHLSYLLTWFSLSGVTFFMWLKKFSFL